VLQSLSRAALPQGRSRDAKISTENEFFFLTVGVPPV